MLIWTMANHYAQKLQDKAPLYDRKRSGFQLARRGGKYLETHLQEIMEMLAFFQCRPSLTRDSTRIT